jgi:hypothetical protein
LDILLIDTLGELDYPATAGAARRVFEERATHAFPPTFVMPPEWRPELENLAHFSTTSSVPEPSLVSKTGT